MVRKNTVCGKLGFGGILLLAALLLCLSPAYGSGTITENFANNQYNTDLWGLWNIGQGTTAQVVNNRLEGTVSGSGNAGLYGWGFTLIGDFEMRVDFTLINWPPSNLTQITIGLNNQSTTLCQVGRANAPINIVHGGEQYFTFIMDTNNSTGVTGPTLNGTLRMVRTGNKMEGFYWNGTGWESIWSATNGALGSRASVGLGIGPYANNYSGISAQAAFSNIRIDYTTLAPGFNQGNAGPGTMLLLGN
jgi:hypothetical protein